MASNDVTFADVMEFFKSNWAPAIELLHRKKGGIIGDFLVQVFEAVKELPTCEVRTCMYCIYNSIFAIYNSIFVKGNNLDACNIKIAFY